MTEQQDRSPARTAEPNDEMVAEGVVAQTLDRATELPIPLLQLVHDAVDPCFIEGTGIDGYQGLQVCEIRVALPLEEVNGAVEVESDARHGPVTGGLEMMLVVSSDQIAPRL
jgi:hypothetical protein